MTDNEPARMQSSELAQKRGEKWWKPVIAPPTVREFLKLRDLPGVLFFSSWLLLVAGLGYAVCASRNTAFLIPAIVVYGVVLSFAYACSHECAHRTAFRTPWLNETVYYISSFIFGQEPMYRRYSHISHHAKTWYPGKDAQMEYHNPITLPEYFLHTSGIPVWCGVITTTTRHAAGRLNEAEREVIPTAEVRKLIWGSRAFLGGYAALAAVAMSGLSPLPVYLFFLPRFVGGWVVHFFINTQHMCMAEARPDHRDTTRSVDCSYLGRYLYWNMNYHIEHHLFPGVPFHNLKALSDALGAQLPIPGRSVVGVNRDILRIIAAQKREPTLSDPPRYRRR